MVMLLRNRQSHKSDATILETPQMISVVNRAQFSFFVTVSRLFYINNPNIHYLIVWLT